jgi:tellurite resistance protein TehA-like permease
MFSVYVFRGKKKEMKPTKYIKIYWLVIAASLINLAIYMHKDYIDLFGFVLMVTLFCGVSYYTQRKQVLKPKKTEYKYIYKTK